MKNFLLLLFAMSLTLGLSAQDGAKDLKKAKSLLAGYKLDNSKTDNLNEAQGHLKSALADGEIGGLYKTLKVAADVYSAMVSSDQVNLQLGQITEPQFPEAAGKAYSTFLKAFDAAEKKFQVKEALDGIAANALFLNSMGFAKYEAGDAAGALTLFEDYLSADAMLKKNGQAGLLTTDSTYQNQVFIASAMATSAGETSKAEKYLTELVDLGYQDPLVYSNLYALYQDKDPAKAVGYLEQGRKAYPDDVNLLFSEINYYLKEGKLEELTGKLDKAIEAEPNNPSVRATLGNVYERLYTQETEAGNTEKAGEYFDLAEKNYKDVLAIDAESSDANYSLGALYYNKAAIYVDEMNVLAEDFSKEGTKKYDAKKAQAMAQFDQAMPFFKKSYDLNPEDRNTLIALREIYVRKDMFEEAGKIKEQLDAIGG